MKIEIDITESRLAQFIEIMRDNNFAVSINGFHDIFSHENAIGRSDCILDGALIGKTDANNMQTDLEKFKAFQNHILSGPVMDDQQFEEYKHTRKKFNAWRRN